MTVIGKYLNQRKQSIEETIINQKENIRISEKYIAELAHELSELDMAIQLLDPDIKKA